MPSAYVENSLYDEIFQFSGGGSVELFVEWRVGQSLYTHTDTIVFIITYTQKSESIHSVNKDRQEKSPTFSW